MAGKKISVKFDVQEDLVKMLEYAAEEYKLGISLKPCDAFSTLLPLMVTGMCFSNKSVAFVAHLMEVGIRKSTNLKKINDMICLSC